jgi:hypothetical protein
MQPADKLLLLDNLRFAQQAYKRKTKSPKIFHFDSVANLNRNSFCNFVFVFISFNLCFFRFNPVYRPRRPLGRVEV